MHCTASLSASAAPDVAHSEPSPNFVVVVVLLFGWPCASCPPVALPAAARGARPLRLPLLIPAYLSHSQPHTLAPHYRHHHHQHHLDNHHFPLPTYLSLPPQPRLRRPVDSACPALPYPVCCPGCTAAPSEARPSCPTSATHSSPTTLPTRPAPDGLLRRRRRRWPIASQQPPTRPRTTNPASVPIALHLSAAFPRCRCRCLALPCLALSCLAFATHLSFPRSRQRVRPSMNSSPLRRLLRSTSRCSPKVRPLCSTAPPTTPSPATATAAVRLPWRRLSHLVPSCPPRLLSSAPAHNPRLTRSPDTLLTPPNHPNSWRLQLERSLRRSLVPLLAP